MTDADKKLCREIAKLEGWEFRHGDYFFCWRAPLDTAFGFIHPPTYLTSDSEFRRMVEALIEYRGGVYLSKAFSGGICLTMTPEEPQRINGGWLHKGGRQYPPPFPRAVALAFRDMLKAQKGAKT